MLIAVVNASTRVTDAQVQRMVGAVASQVWYQVCPMWNRLTTPVVFYPYTVLPPKGAYVIGVADDSDQAGALGWHTEDGSGLVFGRVFASPVLDHGGDVLVGPQSVASVLSHEVIEAIVDPYVNLWADASTTESVALEACDPVESDSYLIHGVAVSNFVGPKWFDQNAQPGDHLDWLGRLKQPFTISPGGYVVYRAAGQDQQMFGDEFPEWKLTVKADRLARTRRRHDATALMQPQPTETSAAT